MGSAAQLALLVSKVQAIQAVRGLVALPHPAGGVGSGILITTGCRRGPVPIRFALPSWRKVLISAPIWPNVNFLRFLNPNLFAIAIFRDRDN